MTSLFSLRLQQDPDFAATASHKNEKCQQAPRCALRIVVPCCLEILS